MDPVEIKSIVESLIFASEKPITIPHIRKIIGEDEITNEEIRNAIGELRQNYAGPGRGIELAEVAMGFQFRTISSFSTLIMNMKDESKPFKLSQASVETLAIIAYRQPVIKVEIDKIRGVDSGYIIRTLMEKRFVRISGRADLPGKPMQYSTTKEFLAFFGLKNINELPSLREFDDFKTLQASNPVTGDSLSTEDIIGSELHREESETESQEAEYSNQDEELDSSPSDVENQDTEPEPVETSESETDFEPENNPDPETDIEPEQEMTQEEDIEPDNEPEEELEPDSEPAPESDDEHEDEAESVTDPEYKPGENN